MLKTLLNLLFPVFCIGCGKSGGWLCSRCAKRLIPTVPECFVCRRISGEYRTHNSCLRPSSPTRAIPLWRYSDLGRDLMRDFKFKGYFDLQSTFAAIIKQRLSHIPEIRELVKESTIVPIPLHRTRQNERGFNQSEILARIITQFAWEEYGFDLKVVPLLHKGSANQHQSSSTVEERRTNVKGVYQINEIVAKDCPKILIVDDVITTGSTVSEAIATISEWYSINRSTQPEINCMALFRGRAYFNKRAAPSQPVPTDYSTISAS